MNYGAARVRKVYPVWFVIYFVLLFAMVVFKFRAPTAMLIFMIFFLLKDVFIDLKLMDLKFPELYWGEHGPLALLVFILGVLGYIGLDYFDGYVGYTTMLISGVDFIIDFADDLSNNTPYKHIK